MTTDEPRPSNGDDEGCPPPPEQCDPRVIDIVACRAAGVAAQAEYDKKYTADLEAAKTQYDDVRKRYRDARRDAALPYKEMRHQAKHLLERIRCTIEQRRVWVCIDEAFCEVVEELDCCQHPPGCCARERAFDVSGAEDFGLPALDRTIRRYQRWSDEAKKCFDDLAAEPEALAKRVADAKALLTAVESAINGDPATTDLKVQYATAKVAQRQVLGVYGGFETIQSFVDCLCLALSTWTSGCQSISELTRIEAFKKCCEDQAEARCVKLATNTVDEIMAVYDRLCGDDRCDDEPAPPPADECRCGCHCHDGDDDDGHGQHQPGGKEGRKGGCHGQGGPDAHDDTEDADDDDDPDDHEDDETCGRCGRRHRRRGDHHEHRHHEHRPGCGCVDAEDDD